MAFPAPDIPDLTCRCGRWNNKIHCPGCGGYAVLALGVKHNTAVQIGSDTIIVPSFKCRRCNLKFSDYEWRYKCEAPRYESASMQQRRLKDEVTTKMNKAREDMKQTAMQRGATEEQASHAAMSYFWWKQGKGSILKNTDKAEMMQFLGVDAAKEPIN